MTKVANPLKSETISYGESHPDEAEGHPSDFLYVKIAVTLALLTAIEVALSYLDMPHVLLVGLLLFVMAIKFGMVAAFFMHLKFDNRLLNRVFYSGLFLAIGVYVAALFMFHFFRY